MGKHVDRKVVVNEDGTRMVRKGTKCYRCGKRGQMYYICKKCIGTCVKCMLKYQHEYNITMRVKVMYRNRRRGVKGREIADKTAKRIGRREQRLEIEHRWRERNLEVARYRSKILGRIRRAIARGDEELGMVCAGCEAKRHSRRFGKLYVHVNWDKQGDSEHTPEYEWLCSLCLGECRRKDDTVM